MKIALLIVDMQNVFLQDQKKSAALREACEHINYVADRLRSINHCVIHIQDIEGAQELDSDLYDFIPEIKIEKNDLRITKEASNSFWNTGLEQILLDQEVDLVIVSGFAAEYCVLATYNGAIERGFHAVMLQNGVLSTKNDAVLHTYRDRNVISYPVIDYIVKNSFDID